MEKDKIISIIEMYQERFKKEGVFKRRMDTSSKERLRKDEMLAHAHFLTEGVLEFVKNPEKKGKTGRHLGSMQMLLRCAGWYSLDELMNHNKP